MASISPNPSLRAFRNVRKNNTSLRIDLGSCIDFSARDEAGLYDTKRL